MADNTTGLHVKSLATESVRAKIVDAAGTNEAAVSAAGRISVDGSGVTQPVSIAATVVVDSELPAAVALTSDAVASPTAPATGSFLHGYNGTTWDRVRTANTGRLQVDVITGGGSNASIFVDNAGFTPDTSSVTMVGGLFDDTAGAALAENDAAAIRIDSKRALIGVIEDATTRSQKLAVSAAGAASINITQVGGSTISATVPVASRLTDGTAFYTKTGQLATTAAFAQLSDQTTAVGVIAGTTALKTDLSSVAGTATVTGGIAGVQSIGGPTAADAAIAAQPVTIGGRASTALPTAMSADGDVVNAWLSLNGSMNVILRDTTGTYVAPSGTQYVGDAVATATPTGTVGMGLANAAAPADVSANNDAVAMWMLRNGSPVVNIAAGGTLLTNIGQAAATATFVRINDGTTTAGVIVGTTALKSDLSSIAGTAPGATSFVPSRLTDGTAYYTNTGQTAGTSIFGRINDGTTTAGVIVGTTALKTDMSSIVGAVPSATNPLPVRLADGAAFYSAVSEAPVAPTVSTVTSAALGAGASVDLNHTLIANGTTGRLAGIDVASTVPLKIEIKTVDGADSPTTRVVLFAPTYSGIQWRSPYPTYITRAGAAANTRFRVTVTNKDNNTAADVYSTCFFDVI